jgi:hypothetical protein
MAQPSALGNQRYVNDPEARSEMGLTSRAVTATGVQGTAFDVEDAVAILATLSVSAVAGTTPSATLTLETSVDGTNWDTVASFPAATAVSTRGKVFGPLGTKARWNVTAFSGSATPSVTLSVATTVRRGS